MLKIISILIIILIPTLSLSKKIPNAFLYFNNNNYELVKIIDSKNIYLPAGTKLNSWTTMISVEEYKNIPDNVSPTEYAYLIAKKIKVKYPKAKFAIKKYNFSKTVILMILNNFKYKNKEITDYSIIKVRRSLHNKNFLSFRYIIRNYGKITKSFSDILKTNKAFLTNLVKSADIPKLIK